MPIVFVHGVSNRDTDPSYIQSRALRAQMVHEIIGPAYRQFPSLAELQEVYWGDLGVRFRWGMKSLPTEITRESAAGDLGAATGLTEFLAQNELDCASESTESPLLRAAKNKPDQLIEQFAQTLVDGLKDSQSLNDDRIDPTFSDLAVVEGSQIADLLIRADEAKGDSTFLNSLKKTNSDIEVMQALGERLAFDQQADLARERQEGVGDAIVSGWSWLQGKAGQANDWVCDKWDDTRDAAAREASVRLLRRYRQQLSKGSFLFFGDIFEYIRRGQGENGTIKRSVRDQIRMASGNRLGGEPLIVVSHSFGGEVVYDLLTSNELSETPIDLWVTVGSQVGLFAEMAIYDTAPTTVPPAGHLPMPPGVTKWINVYDSVDVFSFLCEPVFGQNVKDIKLGTGSAKSAHGAYFTNPEFYRMIVREKP